MEVEMLLFFAAKKTKDYQRTPEHERQRTDEVKAP
jgi:hypothetical protein